MRPPRLLLAPALGLGAAALEGLALALLAAGPTTALAAALPLHLLAVGATGCAASLRPGTTATDRDLVLLLAALLPPFGVLLGWSLPPGPGGRGQDAHAAFEAARHREEARNRAKDRTRRQAAAEPAWSFDEILTHGSLDHRRNALRQLAQLGGPRHLELLRSALGHRDPELRLAAYAEVDRVRRRFQDRLDALAAELDDPRADHADVHRRLAREHRALARSGLLDAAVARFHLDRSAEHAERAWEAGLDDLWTTVARATAGLDRGDPETALATLEQLGEVVDTDAALTTCESLWNLRRFAEARAQAVLLREHGKDLPPWVEALAEHAAPSTPQEVG